MVADRMATVGLSRRRFITVCAGTSLSLATGAAQAGARHLTWKGVALGAEAQIQLHGQDVEHARQVMRQCRDEIDRLEAMFSLYRPESLINRLNRHGEVIAPPAEMIELTALAQSVSRTTDGAFDITVQPLWQLCADHYATTENASAELKPDQLQRALRAVGYERIDLSLQRIALMRKDMAVTFNGIAQGYITDRVRTLLKRLGYTDVLVHLGETFGSGSRPDGSSWVAGISGPGDEHDTVRQVQLRNRALATSGGYGHTFSPDGSRHHIFDPRSGLSPRRYHSVSVCAPSAALADALSTAFCCMSRQQMRAAIDCHAETQVLIVERDGRVRDI